LSGAPLVGAPLGDGDGGEDVDDDVDAGADEDADEDEDVDEDVGEDGGVGRATMARRPYIGRLAWNARVKPPPPALGRGEEDR
jgi:hypothetical protein